MCALVDSTRQPPMATPASPARGWPPALTSSACARAPSEPAVLQQASQQPHGSPAWSRLRLEWPILLKSVNKMRRSHLPQPMRLTCGARAPCIASPQRLFASLAQQSTAARQGQGSAIPWCSEVAVTSGTAARSPRHLSLAVSSPGPTLCVPTALAQLQQGARDPHIPCNRLPGLATPSSQSSPAAAPAGRALRWLVAQGAPEGAPGAPEQAGRLVAEHALQPSPTAASARQHQALSSCS